jgi:hypothetical protein
VLVALRRLRAPASSSVPLFSIRPGSLPGPIVPHDPTSGHMSPAETNHTSTFPEKREISAVPIEERLSERASRSDMTPFVTMIKPGSLTSAGSASVAFDVAGASTLRHHWPPRGASTAGGSGSESLDPERDGHRLISQISRNVDEDSSFWDPINRAADASAPGRDLFVAARSAAEIADRRSEHKMRKPCAHRYQRRGRRTTFVHEWYEHVTFGEMNSKVE